MHLSALSGCFSVLAIALGNASQGNCAEHDPVVGHVRLIPKVHLGMGHESMKRGETKLCQQAFRAQPVNCFRGALILSHTHSYKESRISNRSGPTVLLAVKLHFQTCLIGFRLPLEFMCRRPLEQGGYSLCHRELVVDQSCWQLVHRDPFGRSLT